MFLSIIMPVYNNEKYFPRAVKGIMEQDFSDFELIIIDDGSTDNTPQIADKLADKDKRIRVIHQTNQWIYASMNRGIDAAAGDYIYIVNSDDGLRKNSLRLLAEKVKEYQPDIIWTKVLSHECDSEQNIISYDISQLDRKVTKEVFYKNKKEVRAAWPYFISTFLAQNQANLYSRELMGKHRFRNDVYGADYFFNISLASDVESALVLKEPVYDFYVYKTTEMNASVGKFYSYEHDMFNEMYFEYLNLFQKWGIPKASYQELLCSRRLKNISAELKSLTYLNCNMTTEQKIEYVLKKIADKTVWECACENNRKEELESRILSGIRVLLVQEILPIDSEMYFVYELLEALLCYEKDDEDYAKIERGIYHPLNPYHIGKCFYDKLCLTKDGSL